MCGIAGGVGISSQNQIDLLTALNHRGPDSNGWVKLKNNTHIGMVRLAILDAEGGEQPMFSDCRNFALVFNGEIYNHLDLRQDLENRGCVFQSKNSDTEVLLQGLIYDNISFLKKIRGMFAFAFYDRRQNSLTFGRDYFGQKPLYIYKNNGTCIFTSELQALKKLNLPLKINPRAIKDFIHFGSVQVDDCIYNEVNELKPGYSVLLNLDTLEIENRGPWYENGFPFTKENISFENLFESVVQRHTISDVGFTVSLSGGVDSNSIAQYMPTNFDALFLSYTDNDHEKKIVEANYSFLKNQLHIIKDHHILTVKDQLNLIGKFDEPYSGSLLSNGIYSAARNLSKVIITGSGGDELFGNYFKGKASFPKRIWNSLKYFKRPGIKSIMPYYFPYIATNKLFFDSTITSSEKALFNLLNEKHKTRFEKLAIATINHQLAPEFLKVTDRLSSLNSVEARVPFLDLDLYAHVLSLNDKQRFGSKKNGKEYLRNHLKRIPKNIWEHKKFGFIELKRDELDVCLAKEPINEFLKEIIDFKQEIRNKTLKRRVLIVNYWLNQNL